MANSGNVLAFCVVFLSFLMSVSGLVSHFKLGECMNISQEVGRIASLTLTPYPPRLPGDLTVSGSIHLYQPVKGNVTAKVEIRRKLGFLGYALAIPCISNVGTCTYTDVCALISGKVKTTTAVPTTTTAVPTTTTAVPTTTTAVPTTTTAVPTTTTAVPTTTTAVPTATTAGPTTSTAVPTTSTAVPTTSTAAPTTTAVPAATASVPQTTTSVPTQKSASVSDMPVTSRLPSTDSPTATTDGPVTSTMMATDTLISTTATPITYASAWTSTLGDVSTGNDVTTTEASDPLIGRRDVDGDGDWTAGTDADMVSNPTDFVSMTTPSHSTLKASEIAVTLLPATETSQPVQNTVSTTASETSEPVQTTASTAAVTQTQEPVKSTATMTPSSTESPATETQPPTTSTATMKATDKPVTQSVTDVSKTPSTTSFLQEVSMTTEKYECPAVLADNNIPCRCPFDVGVYTIPPTLFQIPDLGAFSSLAKGDYQVTVSFYDGETDEMLMCQVAEFSLSSGTASPTKECHGLGCIIG